MVAHVGHHPAIRLLYISSVFLNEVGTIPKSLFIMSLVQRCLFPNPTSADPRRGWSEW